MSAFKVFHMVFILLVFCDLAKTFDKDGILNRKSFSIKSEILSFAKSKDSPSSKVRLKNIGIDELYSLEQGRAKITFQYKNYPNFYQEVVYDVNQKKGLIYRHQERACRKYTIEDLHDELCQYGEFVNYLEGQLEKPLGDQYKHIIGPARILFIIASLESKQFESSSREQDHLIRNSYVDTYRYKTQNFKEFSMTVSWDRSVGYTWPNAPIWERPARISANMNGSESHIEISYYRLEDISKGFLSSEVTKYQTLDLSASRLLHDDFLFPISYQCSLFLRDKDENSPMGDLKVVPSIFSRYNASTIQFSFWAQTDEKNHHRSHRHFVAYDGYLDAIRVESKKISVRSLFGPRDSWKIWDLKGNRNYMISEKTNLRYGKDFDDMIKISDNPVDENACSISLLDYGLTPLNIDKFLFGEHQFIYMGRAQVRGINAYVYEAKGEHLPLWLGQPLLYQFTKTKTYDKREMGRSIEESLSGQKDLSLSIQLYLAAESSEVKPLLLEVFDMSISFLSSYRLMVTVNFADFQFDLQDSPTGTPSSSLFKLADVCSSSRVTDKYNEFEMVLEVSESENVIESKIWQDYKTYQAKHSLIRALRDVFDLQPVMMFDFTSKIINEKSLVVSFRLADHPQRLHSVVFQGNGKIDRSTGNDILRVPALSPADCMWVFRDLGLNSGHLMFCESAGYCLFDRDLLKKENLNLQDSQVFKLGPQYPCELFTVELAKDHRIKVQFAAENLERYLNEKIHIYNSSRKHPQIEAVIKHLRIKPVNHFAKVSLKQSIDEQTDEDRARVVYPGFSLTDKFTYRPSWLDEQKRVTLDQCRVACMANFKCRWFSYCSRGQNTCLMSDSSVRADEVAKNLRSYQLLDSGTTSLVKGIFIDRDNFQIERNAFCETHAKIITDYFQEHFNVKASLKTLQLMSTTRGIDHCAELCLEANTKLMNTLNVTLPGQADRLSQFCSWFLVLHRPLSETQTKYLQDTYGLDTESSIDYCFFDSSVGLRYRDMMEHHLKREEILPSTSYQFNFDTMYRKLRGFLLLGSAQTARENQAYKVIVEQSTTVKLDRLEAKEILKSAVEGGKNFQLTSYVDHMNCARRCFLQTTNLWPACKSFDMITTREGTLCALNTLDLETASNLNLVSVDSSGSATHYQIADKFLEEMSLEDRRPEVRDQVHTDCCESTSHWSQLIHLLVFCISAAMGFYLGILVAAMLCKGRDYNQREKNRLINLANFHELAANELLNSAGDQAVGE